MTLAGTERDPAGCRSDDRIQLLNLPAVVHVPASAGDLPRGGAFLEEPLVEPHDGLARRAILPQEVSGSRQVCLCIPAQALEQPV